MLRNLTIGMGVAVASALFGASMTAAAPPPAQCIGKHCAIVAGGPAFPAVALVAETGLSLVAPGPVFHPALGIYCVVPNANAVAPKVYVPLVSVVDDLTVPLGANISPGASLAEINHAAKACVVAGAKIPALEVDTFQIIPGAAPPVVVPSDNVGFDVQF